MAIVKMKESKAANKRKWRPGVEYRCVVSASPGYKTGQIYKAYANDDGVTCLRGSDGFEDICTMLVSEFKEVDN